MSKPALTQNPIFRAGLPVSGLAWLPGLFGLGFLSLSYLLPGLLPTLMSMSAGGALIALSLLLWAVGRLAGRERGQINSSIDAFIRHDASPSFTTDADGVIQKCNGAAEERFPAATGETLVRSLRELFANPAAVLMRLQSRAEAKGAAREDIVTRRGHVRLAVHQIGDDQYLWRLEDMLERAAAGRGADSLSLPMLTASKSGTILFMNDALRRILGGRVKTLDRVFDDLPLRPNGVHRVAGADGPIIVRVVEIEGGGGRREIFLIPHGTEEDAEAPAMIPAATSGEMFERMPVALLKLSRDGQVRQANRMARELLGEGARAGTALQDLVDGLGRSVADWLEEGASGRSLNRPEVLRPRQMDREVYLQITLGKLIEDGETLLIAVLNDATELKTLEAQVVQSQKMQAIGQLAGGVAHDFNNLLTAISGHCDLLLLRHDQGDPDFGDLVQINQNANRAASLVGQLLAFSRKQNLRPEVLDLRDTLSDLTHLLNRLVGEKVILSLTHDPSLRTIRADKRQLEQVMMNLVVNARDAMPDGGDIRIETEALSLSEPLKRDRASVPEGDYVVVKVTDEGIGIPADKVQKIFEPFYTTKRTGEGTGLGLSTAYGIVKQSGGYIFVDSVPGSGTTFTLFFPAFDRLPEEETAPPPALHGAALKKGEGVILLVEDEAPVRAFASRALRMRGYTVLEAESAEEALKTLEDGALKVDVFVTDVIMPGMDGPSWVREALKARPGVKVVFVSGYAEDSFSDEQAQIPNSVFLPKPFSLNELTATVQDQIH